MSVIRFELSLTIARPRDEVFAWWSDPANIPAWQSGVTGVDDDGAPAGVGKRWTVHRKALGLKQQMRAEILEFDAGRRVVERATGGPATNTVTTRFEDAGGQTRMLTTVEVDLGGALGRIGGKLAGGKIRKQAEGDQQRLKQVLEAR